MKTDVEAIKNQVMRYIEACKTAEEEKGKLLCLWLDKQAEQFATCEVLLSSLASPQPTAPPEDELLDVKEMARRTGLKIGTLYSWRSMGKIKSYKYGGRVRFSWSEVSQWAKEASQQRATKFKTAKNKA